MSTISLCVIARDEEELLPRCLSSVSGAVDEVIVVDTGSTDRTVALAEAAGAKVISHTWHDDFAAARNTAAAAASCDWILVLDADELLAPGAFAALRNATRQADFECGFLPLYNAISGDRTPQEVMGSAAARYDEPVALPRLVRRSEDLRWEGPVHESVAGWIARGQRTVKRVEAPIIHYGYTPEVGAKRGKKARNLALLEAWCRQESANPVPWTYFAWELMTAPDPSAAAAAFNASARGWNALTSMAATLRPEELLSQLPSPVALATVRAMLLLRAGHRAEALATVDQAEAWGAEHPNLQILRASLADEAAAQLGSDPNARRAALERARSCYAACLAQRDRLFTDWVIDGATSWAAATGLGGTLLELGDPVAALPAFESALAARSAHLPAALGRVEALIELGRAEEAIAAIAPLLERAELRTQADGWVLAALACHKLGTRTDMAVFAARAERAIAQRGSVVPRRALKLRTMLVTSPATKPAAISAAADKPKRA